MAIVRRREAGVEAEADPNPQPERDRPIADSPPMLTPFDDEHYGEVVDEDTAQRLALAFNAVNKFPGVVNRHKRFVGGATATAVVSTTAVILAYRALHGRIAKGESAAEALKSVTEDEIERGMSLLRKIRRKK